MPIPRILLHLSGHRRRAIDPADVYYLEAQGDGTFVRLQSKTRLKDVRSLGEVLPAFTRHGFVRVHESYVVNPLQIRELRPRKGSRDWELRLESPVGKVLSVSRGRLKTVLKVFGDG